MLRRAVLQNLAGSGLPMAVAFFTIPVLIRDLGTERFGLLALIWATVGYFGLLDLGLGRSLTQQLSRARARGHQEMVASLSWTSLILMAALSLVMAALLSTIAHWGVARLGIETYRAEALDAAQVIALSVPFVVLSAGLRGILEAYGAFGLANLVRMPLGTLIFAGPLAALLLVGPDLVVITWVLLASRVIGFLAYAWAVTQLEPAPLARPAFDRRLVVPLVTAGGWLTLGNIVDPVMGNADRFVIAATISASAVAYYATPSELITKLWIIPAALGTVLFPRFAAQLASGREDIWPLFRACLRWLFVAVFPTTLTMALFANEILTVWIGAEFAQHSAPLMQIFAFGLLANCLATVPFNLIQSSGAARITALLYCVEMPLYLLVLWQLTARFGLPGAAAAWFLRISIDAALLFHFAVRLVPGCPWRMAMVPALLPRMAIVALPFLACLVDDLAVRSAVAATALVAILAGVAWPLATASRAA